MESERKGRKDGESERGVVYHQCKERREKRENLSPQRYREDTTLPNTTLIQSRTRRPNRE